MATLILTPWQAAARAGLAWAIPNASADINTADTVLACRNDNEIRPFYIHSVMAGSDAVGELVVHRITAAYTSAGTAITPINLSDVDAVTSELTCHGDETGNTQGDIVGKIGVPVSGMREIVYNGGLILQPGHAIGVDIVGEPTLNWCVVLGYFEIEDAA
ncbi:hypothetical protein LCGC14_1674200 [marine sediment metagenome]|uniref:Uncharacterized protein n=1 Tax=marine sediment metagenome TaxID=412755 RepID=A0A0F9KQB1_9ZZZZ